MCCFSRPVQSVSATSIFARSGVNGRQLLVYSMTLKAKEDLAMVLPLPVKSGSGEKAVSFIDLKDYPDFFADLRKGFPEPLAQLSPGRSRSLGAAPEAKLEVVTVGNFEASFVPTVADFSRLDERFRLPPGTWEKLPVYRVHGSFPRANPAELFFPTVHIHDGKVHERAKFDHVLYCQRGAADQFTLLDWEESFRPAGFFMQLNKAKSVLDGGEHCYKRTLTGTLPNKDTVLKSEG
jgi:hypothetical protein